MRQARVAAIALTLLAAAATPACKEPSQQLPEMVSAPAAGVGAGAASASVAAEPAPSPAPTGSSVPAEVEDFAGRWESCIHWGGEEPYDEERKKEIADAIAASCPGNEETVQALEKKYATNPAAIKRLKTLIGRE